MCLLGEADEGDPALPLPRLAGGRHPGRGQRHDRHHRLGAETAAAVGEPSHRRTLQVAGRFIVARIYNSVVFCVNACVDFGRSAGAGRTGTFIALSNILERVKAEGLLDVFQTVKSLRMQRPHMVQTVVSVSGLVHHHRDKCCLISTVRQPNPAFLFPPPPQEQYDFCYRVVQDFVDIFSDYANFKWGVLP